MGHGMSLLGSLAPPLESLLTVFGHTLAFAVPEAETELGFGVPLLGSAAQFQEGSRFCSSHQQSLLKTFFMGSRTGESGPRFRT